MARAGTARVRPVAVPSDLSDDAPADGLVRLPLWVRWSAPSLEYDLSDPRQLQSVYEQVLREGSENDVRAYVRASTLIDVFEALNLPQHVRAAWVPWIAARRGGLTREEHRSLTLHCAIAARLIADPESVVAKARQNLAVMREANRDGGAEVWFDEWEQLLSRPVSHIIDVLVSTDQRARDLRQVTPFAGVLSDEERRDLYSTRPAPAPVLPIPRRGLTREQ